MEKNKGRKIWFKMSEFVQQFIQQFIIFSENLSPAELWIVIALDFLLFLYLVYRLLGLSGVLAVVVMVFLAYILYKDNFFEKYQERNKNEAAHMKLIDDELRKK